MRITTGKFKNRKLFMPMGIRPTQNKVRKAVFDILASVAGLSFLELFAGSGAVGFEALSRGAAFLILIEDNPECLGVIKKNIELLGAQDCILYPKEAEAAIKAFRGQAKRFDIIFLDPPYRTEAFPRPGSGSTATSHREPLAKKVLQTLSAYDILAPDGLVIIQHFSKDNLPEASGDLVLCKRARYGDTTISFYKRKAAVP